MIDVERLKPINRKIIVKCKPVEKVGRIIVPETHKKPSQKGIVIAVAKPGKNDEPMSVKKGDVITFEKYIGIKIQTSEDRENEYYFLNEENIIAIIEE